MTTRALYGSGASYGTFPPWVDYTVWSVLAVCVVIYYVRKLVKRKK